MNDKTINWKEEFTKLFPETTTRTLKENEKWCPKCSGLGFKRNGEYLSFCNNCEGQGVIKLCACGNEISHRSIKCEDCKDIERKEESNQREILTFEKAEKIPYKNYKGYFLWNDRAIDNEDFEEQLYDVISNGEEAPKYIYATRKELVFGGLNLEDEIICKCDDNGYEDMSSYLNMDSEKLQQAQKLIDEWTEEQGDSMYIYYEEWSKVVLLDELIEEIKREIENNKAQGGIN